jgi:hypothetical protein
MSFELKNDTARGLFHVRLVGDISTEQMIQLCQLAENIVGTRTAPVPFGPRMEDGSLVSHLRQEQDSRPYTLRPERLGMRPVESISMGDYKEPENGVRLKMLHPVRNIAEACKVLRAETNISMRGCKEILDGNYPCPRMSPELAESIIVRFETIGVYVRIQEAA